MIVNFACRICSDSIVFNRDRAAIEQFRTVVKTTYQGANNQFPIFYQFVNCDLGHKVWSQKECAELVEMLITITPELQASGLNDLLLQFLRILNHCVMSGHSASFN